MQRLAAAASLVSIFIVEFAIRAFMIVKILTPLLILAKESDCQA
jgi:hypothetical protein